MRSRGLRSACPASDRGLTRSEWAAYWRIRPVSEAFDGVEQWVDLSEDEVDEYEVTGAGDQ
jgi:hypothetical protein